MYLLLNFLAYLLGRLLSFTFILLKYELGCALVMNLVSNLVLWLFILQISFLSGE